MRGQRDRDRTVPVAAVVGVTSVVILALLATSLVIGYEGRSRAADSEACEAARNVRPSVDVSAWHGDPALAYADVPRFNEEPDAYQTVWMRRLERLTASPDLDPAVSSFMTTLIEPNAPAPIGGKAQMLLWVAQGIPEGAQSRAAVATAAAGLKQDWGFAADTGEPASVLATARVAIALALHGEPLARETLDSLRDELKIGASGRFEDAAPASVEVQALIVQALAMHGGLTDKPTAERALNAAIVQFAASAVTPETISPIYTTLMALRDTGAPPPAVDISLSSEFVGFDGGWFAFAGASAPDPQLTFYMQALGLGAESMNLKWGAVQAGWRSVQGASVAASGVWARISLHCGMSFEGDKRAIEELAMNQLRRDDLIPQDALQVAHLVVASRGELDSRYVSSRLDRLLVSSVEAADWIGAARIVSAANLLDIELSNKLEPPRPLAADSSLELRAVMVLAHYVGNREAEAEAAEKARELRRDGAFAYEPSSPSPDIISTSFLAPTADSASDLEIFKADPYYCESVADLSGDCSATLLALAAAVETEVEVDARSMWW